ncbi:hypothetical protein BACI71_110677 [Bacillus mycoides]|uniref:Uncharacterized protein n=1 Tax=Bacillus mycoides TaxID=1405 RepID=A0A653R7T4_BACMY|nr:hypothetical protein BACI71_110677 [Bacillus mycoides]
MIHFMKGDKVWIIIRKDEYLFFRGMQNGEEKSGISIFRRS